MLVKWGVFGVVVVEGFKKESALLPRAVVSFLEADNLEVVGPKELCRPLDTLLLLRDRGVKEFPRGGAAMVGPACLSSSRATVRAVAESFMSGKRAEITWGGIGTEESSSLASPRTSIPIN